LIDGEKKEGRKKMDMMFCIDFLFAWLWENTQCLLRRYRYYTIYLFFGKTSKLENIIYIYILYIYIYTRILDIIIQRENFFKPKVKYDNT
jgi:hypothetical protein